MGWCFIVADGPTHSRSGFTRWLLGLMLNREFASDDVDDMAFGAPVAGEIAGGIFDDPQLKVSDLTRPRILPHQMRPAPWLPVSVTNP
jgi:hypothetical protein